MKKIYHKIFAPLKFIIFIATGILIFIFFRFIGLKGLLGFITGMLIMAYALLSKNKYLSWLVKLTDSEEYLWDLMKR